MTLNQLYYFEKTARLQHITKAAEALCISQPSLSISLSNLESELGVPLLEKDGRNIQLTRQGETFLEYTDRILADIAYAKEAMNQYTKEKETHIRLGYVAPLGHKFIPQTIRCFLDSEQNKNISFTLESDTTEFMVEKLKQDYYDIGLCSEVNEPELVQVPIIEQPVVLIVPHGHDLAKHQHILLRQVEPYPLISYFKSSPMQRLIREMYQTIGIEPKITCDAPDELTIASLVAANFGVALVAQVDLLEERDVTIIPLSDITVSRKIYLTYRKHRKQSSAVNRLIELYSQMPMKRFV